MNEDNKDINEEFENSDNSLNNQSDDEITSQPSETKSADDQIALKVFKYFKEFISVSYTHLTLPTSDLV